MAVVKLGRPVKSNLGGPNGAMAYIIDPAKTDGGRLVSSNYERTGTDYDALADPMLEDNENSPKGIQKNSRLAYHIKLSFSPDDPVTPERVHELGVEFAHRITSDEYKFVVATHTDRHHLHDHIMVCAAFRYGKHLKAELPKDIIEQWRVIANEISEREGLSVIFNPATERVARKMRGDETTPNEDPTTHAHDPKHVEETSEPGTAATARTTRRAENEEPMERRYSMSMEEIYASAKGLGTKDRIRMLIDLTLAGAENFEDWRNMLDVQGVDVTVRGQHFTFTMKDTGFKVRDTKLGSAYDMTNIMAGLQSTPVIPITFNRRLVAKQTRKTVTVWLPGTHRKKKITFDAKRLVDDGGSTLRAFLPPPPRPDHPRPVQPVRRQDHHPRSLPVVRRAREPARTTGLARTAAPALRGKPRPAALLPGTGATPRPARRRGEGAERGDPLDQARGRRQRQGTQAAARKGPRIARRTPGRCHRVA